MRLFDRLCRRPQSITPVADRLAWLRRFDELVLESMRAEVLADWERIRARRTEPVTEDPLTNARKDEKSEA